MTLGYSVFCMGRGVSVGHECGFSAAHKTYTLDMSVAVIPKPPIILTSYIRIIK